MQHRERSQTWQPLFVLLAGGALATSACGQGSCAHVATLPADGLSESSSFGGSIDQDGPFLIVGARADDNERGTDAGAAIIYREVDGQPDTWEQVFKLVSPEVGDTQWFGASVQIEGDTVVVGAPNQYWVSDGAVYVFGRNVGGPDNWGLVRTLEPDGLSGASFGSMLALEGDTLAASAPWERGAVGVYYRNHGGVNNWGLVKHVPNPLDVPSLFGRVDIDGDRLVIGNNTSLGEVLILGRHQGGTDAWEPEATLPITGLDVELEDDIIVASPFLSNWASAGIAYVYKQDADDPTVWTKVAELFAPDSRTDDVFARRNISLQGETIVIGAPKAFVDGAAYVFRADDPARKTWRLAAKVPAPLEESVWFSASTLIMGDRLLTGDTSVGGAYVFDLDLAASDCNCNGAPDIQDIKTGASADCNSNGIPDECDLASALSSDCNNNGLPDDCETESDCNGNGFPDECDFASGVSEDCNDNGVPDECEFAYYLDDGQLEAGFYLSDGTLWLNQFIVAPGQETIGAISAPLGQAYEQHDELITLLIYTDPNNDGDPSDAELLYQQDVMLPTMNWDVITMPIEPTVVGEAGDVFYVGVVAEPEMAPGVLAIGDWSRPFQNRSWIAVNNGPVNITDLSDNEYPIARISEIGDVAWEVNWSIRAITVEGAMCAFPGDLNLDGVVNAADLAIVLSNWGPCLPPPASCIADLNGDGNVGPADLAIVLGNWG